MTLCTAANKATNTITRQDTVLINPFFIAAVPIVIVIGMHLLSSWLGWVERSGRHITDEEFLESVPNATPGKALRIRTIISDQLDVPYHDIHPDDNFIDDLDAG